MFGAGFNHFWHAESENHGGDCVYIQGHVSPGVYARAYLEGRLTEEQVAGDWPAWRQRSGDGWQRELFEGADFDAAAAQVLQSPQALEAAGTRPGQWWVTLGRAAPPVAGAWVLHFQGAGWALYRSGGDSAAKRPEPAQHKGLAGCQHQGQHQ